MKQKDKSKVRATHLNEVLMSKRSEKHEEKDGPKAKRAKRKAADKKMIEKESDDE